MNTCGSRHRRPARRRSAGALERGSRGLLGWKAPRARESRRIDVPGGNELTRPGKGCFGNPAPAAARGVRGFDSTERSPAEKAAALSPSPCSSRTKRRVSRSRQRAVKRDGVGGRLSARLSGVADDRAATPAIEAIHEAEDRRVFPRSSGGGSPKRVFHRVLVTRNVGCRSGVRSILATCSRQAARPIEDATSSDGEGR
jgi:hypothetical protein